MTPKKCPHFFLTLLKEKHQLSGCQNLFRSLFLQDFQPNLLKLVHLFCSNMSVPAFSKNVCCSCVFRGKEGGSASCSPHSCHTSNILRLLSRYFQDDDSYKHPTPSRSEPNSLKAAHKWAIQWQSRKALEGSISVHVTANENRADSARHKWSSQTTKIMERKTVLCTTNQSLFLS